MQLSLDPQVFLFLFGGLIVVFTLLIFRMTKASWSGLLAAIVISLILTALAFYKTDPIAGLNVIFYLAVGLGAIPLLYFATKSWSGLAGSVIFALVVVDLYAYYTRAAYGLYVTLALVAVVALAIYLTFALYKYKVKMQSQVLLGCGRDDLPPSLPAQADVFAYLEDLSVKFPNPNKRAKYLLSKPSELAAVYNSLDADTLREVNKLGG